MKCISVKAVGFIFLILLGCNPTSSNIDRVVFDPNHPGERWVNLHKGDPKLKNIVVIQFPDAVHEADAYSAKEAHPAMLIYEFADGKKRQITSQADGTVLSDEWYDERFKFVREGPLMNEP